MKETQKIDESDIVKQLYQIAVEESLESVEFKDRDTYVKIKRKGKEKTKISTEIKQVKDELKPTADVSVDYTPIKAPLNGIFYRAASTQANPFVVEGSVVESGTILCIIEAMKVMNEIRAEVKYKIVKILVENGQSVQIGQEIFWVKAV